jgi:hypothetical protein
MRTFSSLQGLTIQAHPQDFVRALLAGHNLTPKYFPRAVRHVKFVAWLKRAPTLVKLAPRPVRRLAVTRLARFLGKDLPDN